MYCSLRQMRHVRALVLRRQTFLVPELGRAVGMDVKGECGAALFPGACIWTVGDKMIGFGQEEKIYKGLPRTPVRRCVPAVWAAGVCWMARGRDDGRGSSQVPMRFIHLVVSSNKQINSFCLLTTPGRLPKRSGKL